MEIYEIDSILACIVHRSKNWKAGLDFLTRDTDFVQVGTWNYNSGKKLDKHYHNEIKRTAHITQEVVIVMKGSILAHLYNSKFSLAETITLNEGDIGIFLSGGHGYEILSDDTRIIEVKNGPFLGVEVDKTRF